MYETKVCPIVISSEDFCKSIKSAICQNYSPGQVSEEQHFDIVPSYTVTTQLQPKEIKSGICVSTIFKTSEFIPFKIQGVKCCILQHPFYNNKILVHIPTNVKIG
jgi:hypothetical protein